MNNYRSVLTRLRWNAGELLPPNTIPNKMPSGKELDEALKARAEKLLADKGV